MMLSAHFSLEEFCKSAWALRNGVANVPNAAEIAAAMALCEFVLEPVRAHFGRPVVLSSGFRNDRVNKAAGGARTSQHRLGEAGDWEIAGISNAEVATWVWKHLNYDQLILEYYVPGAPNSGWIHTSYRGGRLRNMELTKVPGEAGYRTGLVL